MDDAVCKPSTVCLFIDASIKAINDDDELVLDRDQALSCEELKRLCNELAKLDMQGFVKDWWILSENLVTP
jgi:hypothetical protein